SRAFERKSFILVAAFLKLKYEELALSPRDEELADLGLRVHQGLDDIARERLPKIVLGRVAEVAALESALVLALLACDARKISTGLELFYDLVAACHCRSIIGRHIALAVVRRVDDDRCE